MKICLIQSRGKKLQISAIIRGKKIRMQQSATKFAHFLDLYKDKKIFIKYFLSEKIILFLNVT